MCVYIYICIHMCICIYIYIYEFGQVHGSQDIAYYVSTLKSKNDWPRIVTSALK